MKTKMLLPAIVLSVLIAPTQIFAQASTLNQNSNITTNYIGWNSGVINDLRIAHNNPGNNIDFFTTPPLGGLAVQRMRIHPTGQVALIPT